MPSPLRDTTPSQIIADLYKFVISSFDWDEVSTTTLLGRLEDF